ncbi:histidine phosphatase family protein [Ekhidna sp.]
MKLTLLYSFSILFIIFCHTSFAQLEKIKAHYQALEDQEKISVTVEFIKEEMELVEDFSRLKQIILLRHGEPALEKRGWRKRKDAINFVYSYDTVGVYPPEFNPLQLENNEIDIIFTSSLNRSISTANQLFNTHPDKQADSIYREFERKIFTFFNIKLPLKWWTTGSRIFWVMGLNKKGIESFSEAKHRARIATATLDNHAIENGKTLLVSHGLLNHYLVKYLKKNGWTEVFDGGKGYLSQKVMVKYD